LVVDLRVIGWSQIDLLLNVGAVSQRRTADLGRRRDIRFNQRRRGSEGAGVIVEAEDRVVHRKKSGRIDIDERQCANGIGVLGTVEPMNSDGCQIWMGRRSTVELPLNGTCDQ